jgi:hypothetical protein
VPAPGTLLAPLPANAADATGVLTPAFVRQEAQAVYRELVAGLGAEDRARVAAIPLTVTEDARMVNAVAGCSGGAHHPFVAITTGLLTIEAGSATARARDAALGGNAYEQYATAVAAAARAHGPIPALVVPPTARTVPADARVRAHTRFLLDEQLAFVLGHELSHHYRGHTGCAGGASGAAGGVATIRQVLARAVPLFQQPAEAEADVAGVINLLDVGAHRAGGAWTEEGAQITLDMFGRLDALGVDTAVMVFLEHHPPPQVRRPIVDWTASEWRAGRRPTSYPSPASGNLPLPAGLPAGLPTGLPAR